MFIPYKFSVFFIFYFVLQIGVAQQISHFTKEDGLPSDLIKSVATDNNGFIWLATDEGLIRFDGKNYKHFLKELPSPYIKFLFKRKNGQLLATTDLGLVEIVNPKNPTFPVLLAGKAEPSMQYLSYPKLMYEDRQNTLWIGDNWHVVAWRDGKFKHYEFDSKNKTGHFQRSFSFFEVGKYLYIFSNTGFLYRYVPEKDAFEEMPYPEKATNLFHAISFSTQKAMFSALEGVFELTFDEGGKAKEQKLIQNDLDASYLFNADSLVYASSWTKGLFLISPAHKVTSFKLPTNNISSILPTTNNILLASDNGLLTLNKRTFAPQQQEIASGYIQSFCQDETHVYYTDGEKVVMTPIGKSQEGKVIYKSTFGTLLGIGKRGEEIILSDTKGYILRLVNGQAEKLKDLSDKGKAIFSCFVDSKKRTWFCQDNNSTLVCLLPTNEVKFYDKTQGITSNPLMVKESPDGTVYCGGTQDNGFLFKLNEATDSFENLSQKVDFQHNEPIITNDLAFRDKAVLVGSSFGLLVYENGKFTRKDLGEMASDAVKALVVDSRQDIWLANSKGVLKLLPNEILLFDELQGLPSKGIGYRAFLIDSTQKLWIGTFNGVGLMQDITRFYKTPLPTLVSVSTEPNTKGIYQIYANGFLQIEYVANVLPQKQVRYQIKLQGKWQDMGYKTSLLLSNLPTGKHQLEIRAKQSGNYIWSDSFVIAIEVVQVWYFTWWGILLILLALIVFIWILIRLNTWYHKRNQKHLEGIIELRTNDLKHKNDILETQTQELQNALKNLKETQDQLIHSEKMASLGQLVASVAHEINTPLGAIRSSVESSQYYLQEVLEALPTFLSKLEINEQETFKSVLPEILNAPFVNLSSREKRQFRTQIKEQLEAQGIVRAFDIAEFCAEMGVQFDLLAHEVLCKSPHLYEIVEMMHQITTVQRSNQNIQTATDRAAKIVFALKNFSRQDHSGKKQAININDSVDTVLTIYHSQIKQGVEVAKHFANLPEIDCFPDELIQVWTNLIHNALHAMNNQGMLTIATKQQDNTVIVSIQDTGHGIPEEARDKIFNPFFTTKKLGEGSGLGLDIVKKIVEKHEGTVWFETETGKGTTFFVQIPTK
jgi:signal transduction histidine kinase